MTHSALDYLSRQHETAWRLTRLHLDGLTTEQCLWRPGTRGPHVHQSDDGAWHGEWPEAESYAMDPPSIGWLTWHIGFWWSMVDDHCFGAGRLTADDVLWPGSAGRVIDQLHGLHDRWRTNLSGLDGEDLRSSARTRWPFQDRPLGDIIAWVNLELMKNAAEIGYVRFLYAART